MKKFKYEILLIIFYFLTRIPYLGHDNFNTDSWKWKSRSYDFTSGIFNLDFQKTLQKYHPGVTLMWIGTAGIKSFNLYYDLAYKTTPSENSVTTVFGLDLSIKVFLMLVMSLSLAFLFYPIRKIFGIKYATIAAFLLIMEPFYTGLTRVFHLEGLLSTFMLASSVWIFYYFFEEKRYRIIISGIFAGLAILTKTTSLFMFPFVFLTVCIFSYKNNQRFYLALKEKFKPILIWTSVLVATVFLLWPILWINPLGAYNAVFRGISVIGIEREHEQFYFGKFVTDPGPTFYPVVFAFRSSIWLIAGLLGLIVAGRKALDSQKKKFIAYLLIFSFFYIVEITIPSKKLDRYLLPSITSLSLISSFFYLWVIENTKLHKLLKISICIIPTLVTFIYLTPDYFAYYNPLLGGLKTGINVIEPKWLIGTNQIVSYFTNVRKSQNFAFASDEVSIEKLILKHKQGDTLMICFPEKYYTQIWPFIREFGAWPIIGDLVPQAQYCQYFVYPVWDESDKEKSRFNMEFIDTIKISGVSVYNVYKSLK